MTQEENQPLLTDDKINYDQSNELHTAGIKTYMKNPPSSPPPYTSAAPPWPTTDQSLYKFVPDTYNGILQLDNLEWNDSMNDQMSRVYRDTVNHIENSLIDLLQMENRTPIIKVHSVTRNGEIQFTINEQLLKKPEEIQNFLENKFRENGNLIDKYHVHKLSIASIIDQCQA